MKENHCLSYGTAGGGCSEPCPGWVADDEGVRQWKGGKVPWTRQIETIEITSEDAISDNGQEVYNLMQARSIDNVILMGVHTNICVLDDRLGLGRWFTTKKMLCCVVI